MKRIATLLLLLCSSAALADTRPVAAAASWSIDDVLFAETATDFQVSPDGRWAVYLKTAMDRERGEQVGRLVRIDLRIPEEVQLTRGPDSAEQPRWSPDGRLVAFLSSRSGGKSRRGSDEEEAKAQVWLIDPTGGEPWALTDVARGVTHFEWAGAGTIVFLAQEAPSLTETRRKDVKDDSVVVEDEAHEPPARLFRIEVATEKVTRCTANTDRIEQFAVSPDGRRAVAIHNRSMRYTYDNRIKPEVRLHDLTSGKNERVFTAAEFNISRLRWAAGGEGFYAINDRNSQPQFAQAGVPEVWYYDIGKGKEIRVPLTWERGLATQTANDEAPGLTVTPDGFVALLADGVHNRVARFIRGADGWRREWLTGEHAAQLFGIVASPDGKTLLYAHSTANTPAQWHVARLDGVRLEKPAAITHLNERLRALPRGRSEVARWKGADGDEVEGILYYPQDYKVGERRPLVVMIHGGPAAADEDAWDDSWSYPVQLLCSRGAFVLRPNYHGSSNYGLKWLESITHGRYGEPELVDIERGVDALIARGLVDGGRLGLTGWSNGAILANLLTAQTTRYKVACTGAGTVEYASDWASCEFGDAFDRYYFGASPLEEPGWYQRRSPFWKFDRVRTPTLIFFGTEDRTVATQQGWIQYRGLQQVGKTPVRFVLFPGAKHGLKKLAHQRRKMEEELAWLDKYLFRSEKVVNEAVAEHSPLARALALQKARRDAGRYGLVVRGSLIPEIVPFGKVRAGRFEVTQAQFAAFDPTRPAEAGRDNHPAAGVTFEQAQAYCAWLSRLTGDTYRLPNEAEAEELYDRDGKDENTLDYWAGYRLNPDDAERLRPKVGELKGAAPLLCEVGRFRGAGGRETIFDLGGNVAEWVCNKDGKGIIKGGSADMPADRRPHEAPAAEYRGFRVVLVAGSADPPPGTRKEQR
jgi:dipeptidyl aminopeptidase/acylaminoacyl peptidase